MAFLGFLLGFYLGFPRILLDFDLDLDLDLDLTRFWLDLASILGGSGLIWFGFWSTIAFIALIAL